MLAALAGGMFALAGQAAEAERWADAADRQPDREAARSEDPAAGAWAALLRAMLCRGGAGQMRADADQAASLFAAAGTAVPPVATIMQGLARVLSGDLDGGDTILADAVSAARDVNSRDAFIVALCERALVATARSEWRRAETLAGQARAVLDQGGLEETFVAPGLRRSRPHRPAQRRHPGGTPGRRPRPADAASADLRATPPGRVVPDRAGPQTFQYFSFTTLTTLGYGDFTAAASSGRAVAILEALTGQIFLVTLVARLVAGFRSPGERRD